MYDFVGSYWPILLLALLIGLAVLLRKKHIFFHWAARIVAILDILFLAWESLEKGGYDPSGFFSDNILTNIPLLIILIVAWKYDLVGAIGFAAAGVFFLAYFDWGDFPIGFVPILTGVLFFISWLEKRKKPKLISGNPD